MVHNVKCCVVIFWISVVFPNVFLGQAWAFEPYIPKVSDPITEPWRWTTYPFLKDKRARCVIEDALGTLWFGTDTGVWSYDGKRWALYGDIGQVRALCVGKNYKLYAGSDKGLWVLEGTKWVRVLKNTNNFPWDVSSLSTSTKGLLWAGTLWGGLLVSEENACLFTTQDMATQLETQLVGVEFFVLPKKSDLIERVPPEGILKTSAGQVYWATTEVLSAGLGLHEQVTAVTPINDNEFVLNTTQDAQVGSVQIKKLNQELAIHTLPVYDIFESTDQMVWMSVSSGQIICFDLEQEQLVEVHRGYISGNLTHFFETNEGGIWALSEDESVKVQVFNGQSWQEIELHLNADSNLHTSLFQTRDGNVWIGGHQGVVQVLRKEQWHGYAPPMIPLPRVRVADMVQTADGALWFVSLKQGVVRLDYQTERWASFDGLNFQCETADGTRWFLSEDRSVIRCAGEEWVGWAETDGLMSHPTRVIETKDGVVWATGRHNNQAATAIFVPDVFGGKWQKTIHKDLSWAIESKAVYEDAHGRLWFGAAVGYKASDGHLGGLLKYDPKKQAWHRFYRPDVPGFIYGIGESRDGTIWVGSTSGLFGYNGTHWVPIDEPVVLRDKVDVIHTGPSGTLWVGLRAGDVFSFDGHQWQHFTTAHGLPPGRIRSILEEKNGNVWVGTSAGYSLFDGQTWDRDVLHGNIPGPPREGILVQKNGICINRHEGWNDRNPEDAESLYTLFYTPDLQGPDTRFEVAIEQVQQPGHAIFEWTGTDAWHITADSDLRYAWRFDGGPWSTFVSATHYTALSLPDGWHTFEVVARDRDLNVDPTPAILHFEVIPPVWRQVWFWAILITTGLLIVGGVIGVVSRQRFLRVLATEQKALQAISDSVQNMVSHATLHDVVQVIYEQLAMLEVHFHTLTIHHVLDANAGFCRAYELSKGKQIEQREFVSSRVVEMWEKGTLRYRPDMYHDAGGLEPQMLKNMEKRMGAQIRSVLDMPHARGILSLHSAIPHNFSNKDIVFIKRVAEYLSLGVSRAEDILKMEEALDAARKLAHAVEHSPASVVITDLQGNIDYVNPQFEQVTGYTMAEVMGKNTNILKSGESPPEFYQDLWHTIRAGKVWRGEFHNKKKNGALFWEAASISGVQNASGDITHYIAVKEDITQKKEMEKAQLQIEREQVLVATAGAAAHEINQPLTVILGLTQLLINTVQDEQLQEDLGFMEEAGQAIKQIVARMAHTEHYETKDYVGEAKIVHFSASNGQDE